MKEKEICWNWVKTECCFYILIWENDIFTRGFATSENIFFLESLGEMTFNLTPKPIKSLLITGTQTTKKIKRSSRASIANELRNSSRTSDRWTFGLGENAEIFQRQKLHSLRRCLVSQLVTCSAFFIVCPSVWPSRPSGSYHINSPI